MVCLCSTICRDRLTTSVRFFADDDDRTGIPEWSGVERWILAGVLSGWWDDEFGASYRLTQSGEQLLAREDPDVLELISETSPKRASPRRLQRGAERRRQDIAKP